MKPNLFPGNAYHFKRLDGTLEYKFIFHSWENDKFAKRHHAHECAITIFEMIRDDDEEFSDDLNDLVYVWFLDNDGSTFLPIPSADFAGWLSVLELSQ